MALAGALTALVAGLVAFPTAASADPRILHVAPGAGGDCSATAPCGSVAAAYARADGGDTIALGSGFYPRQDIPYRAAAAGWTSNVLVIAAPGATPKLGGLNIYSPRLTLRGLSVQGYLALYKGADYGRFENLDIQGGAAIAGAHDSAVVGSRVRPPRDLDGLQIKPYNTGDTPPRNVLVEGNDLGPGYLSAGSAAHVDSLQVLGVTNLTVRGNLLREAASNSMILGEGMGQIRDVLIEDNVFEQCRPFRTECNAYNAIWPGINLENVVIRHNTIVGSAYAAVPSGTTFTRNIVTAPMTCTSPVQDNVVEPNSSNCSATNVKARPTFEPNGHTLPLGSPYAGYGIRKAVPSMGAAPAPSPISSPAPTTSPTASPAPSSSPTPTPTPSSAPASRNLLTRDQQDFEVSAGGWTPQGNTTVSRSQTTAATGTAALRVAVDASGPWPDRTGTARVGTLPGTAGVRVTPGSVYSGSMQVKPATRTLAVRCEIRFFRSDGSILSTIGGELVTQIAGAWTRPTCTATAPAGAATAGLRLYVQGAQYGDVHYLDDAWLIAR